MNSIAPRDRVLTTINHRRTDRPPRGELLVEETYLNRVYPESASSSYAEKMERFAEEMMQDIVTVAVDVQEMERDLRDLSRWAMETPYFVLALVDGLFWNADDPVSFERFLMGVVQAEPMIQELIQEKKAKAMALIQRSLDAGAHGVIIGDDLAYDRGPYVSPQCLRESIIPGLEELVRVIKDGDGIAFLHSCGNLTSLLDLILSTGLDGLHGLASTAGNDPLAVRSQTRNRLTLMGIFEVDRLSPKEIQVMKAELIEPLSSSGGYILGSAGGLSANTPPEAVGALYSR